MRTLLALAVLGLTLLAATPAWAILAPTTQIDGTRFIARSDQLQVVSADINVHQLASASGTSEWWVEVEVEMRSLALAPLRIDLAVLDTPAFTDDTEVYVDGVLIRTSTISPRQDPALPEHTYAGARLLPLALPLGGSAVVSVRMRASGTMDGRGQIFVEIPTNALGLFAENVVAGRIQLMATGRLIGFQSTLVEHTVYDEPLNRVTWWLRDWEPRIAFRASFVAPWSALLLVAEIEACPDPWRVMRATTGGQMSVLRDYVGGFDDASLLFCGNLPEILHGRYFESERTREQLLGMTLDRYVPDAFAVSIYRPNPSYSEETLSEPEAIYARSLRTVLSERQ